MAITPIKIIMLLIILAPPRLLAEESIEGFFAMSPAELAMIPVTITNSTPKPIRQTPASSVFSTEQITSRAHSGLTKILDTVQDIPSNLQTQGNDASYSVSSISDGSNAQAEIISRPNPELYGSQLRGKGWQFRYQECLEPTWQTLGEAYCYQPASPTYLR